ncbi:hypothetical protein F3N42_01665 [Marinihelvus fidelis]|uniref:Glycoside hydrolase family 12 n=1 Tax=Marinihelvus fidelis TaxID=2613842 RepID=A0A5N0TDL3_9GAMM|nr:hypothetical protein [Marinihelvus fidelis]KAA9133095.1 hypothetical protein F3N42_01665 [Marinihelvus fidelis]
MNSSSYMILLFALFTATGGNAFAQDAKTQHCGHFETLASPHGIYVNNLWNAHAVGDRPWQQCVEKERTGVEVHYGWNWSWPADSTVVVSYPQVRVGVSPWDPKETFDDRFPAALDTLQALNIAHTLDIQAEGDFNVATSMWLTNTDTFNTEPKPESIVVEVMIWTSQNGRHMRPAGRIAGNLEHAGARWEVWVDRDWKDMSGMHENRWVYLAFRRTESTLAAHFDAAVLLNYAIENELLPNGIYVADVELGTEITNGQGRLRVESFSVDVR